MNNCRYEWTGLIWVEMADNCNSGCNCVAPTIPGSFIDQEIITPCNCPP